MNERLEQFLQAENISKSEFADNLGVSRPSISHILSGRNNPGYDFFKSLSLKYPNLNLGWLITGKGKMYNNQQVPASPPYEYAQNELFNLESHTSAQAPTETHKPAPYNTNKPVEPQKTGSETHNINNPEPTRPNTEINQSHETAQNTILHQDTRTSHSEKPIPGNFAKERRISKVMVFYDDNTFEELT